MLTSLKGVIFYLFLRLVTQKENLQRADVHLEFVRCQRVSSDASASQGSRAQGHLHHGSLVQ